MKECNSGRREFWDGAAERPGFSFAEVLMIHMLGWLPKILAVRHILSAPRRGALLVASELIRGRAPQITRWQDVRYLQEFAPL